MARWHIASIEEGRIRKRPASAAAWCVPGTSEARTRMMTAITLIMVGAALGTAAGAQASSPEEQGDKGVLRHLTHGPTINAMPHWSPDGRRIVFHSRREPETKGPVASRKIWVMNAEGGEAHAVSSGPADEYHPSFSPVGARIVFVSEANGNRDLWIMAEEGTTPIPLTDDPGVEDHPAWSPDGERVVYTSFPKEGGNFDLWIVNSDGSGRHRLTSAAANEIFPAWHPDGGTIAYVTDAPGNFDVYGIRLGDQATFPIVVGPDHDVRPAWSPDGTKIAFARWPARGRTEDSTLWIANSDGSVAIELDVPIGSTHPAWAPDGRQIAFQRRTETGWDISTHTPPPDLARTGRLHLAEQLRAGASDLAVLRTGERLTGTVQNTRYRIRTAYAVLEFERGSVAGLRFDAERGITRLILGNGDSASGILVDDTIRMTIQGGERHLGSEMLASVGLRAPADAPPTPAGLRLTMQNGDVLTATVGPRPLRVRVAGQTIGIAPAVIVFATISDNGTKVSVELASGETVSGDLATTEIHLQLALGPAIAVRPSQIRSVLGPGKARQARKQESLP